jgi:hypothetical protein
VRTESHSEECRKKDEGKRQDEYRESGILNLPPKGCIIPSRVVTIPVANFLFAMLFSEAHMTKPYIGLQRGGVSEATYINSDHSPRRKAQGTTTRPGAKLNLTTTFRGKVIGGKKYQR